MHGAVAEDAIILGRIAGMTVVAVRGDDGTAGGKQFAHRDKRIALFPQPGEQRGQGLSRAVAVAVGVADDDVARFYAVHAPKTAILASNLDTMAYLYTNRTTFRPFVTNPLRLFYGKEGPPIGTAAEMFDRLHYFGVNYLLCMPMPGFAENWPFAAVISALESANAGTLRLVYAGTDPRFKIYALDWNKSATDTSQNKTASALVPQSVSPQ